MDWDVRYNGSSIKDKVLSCNITKSLDSFCREIDIELIDTSIYSAIDWTRIPEAPQIEVSLCDDSTWHTIGAFFIERPTYSADPVSKGMRGIWGRSKTAILGEPYARTFTKTWAAQTDVFAICEEVMAGSGITFSRGKCTPGNFVVYPLTYSCEKAYPIDILNELAELCGAVVRTSNEDDIYFEMVNYSPLTGDFTFSDTNIIDYSEEIQFPDFKNRVLISADGASANCDITLSADSECLNLGSTDGLNLYARVTGDDGRGINNVPVTWTTKHGGVTLDTAVSNTSVMSLSEEVKSTGYYTIQVKFPPSSVTRIEKKNASYGQKNNLANGGLSIDGTTITLVNKLEYCDETLVVTYTTDGVAKNKMRAGGVYGEDTVTASVGSIKATLDVSVGNPCKCTGGGEGEVGYALTLIASPRNICSQGGGLGACPCTATIGCLTKILCAVDEYGPVTDGRTVLWEEVSPSGPFLRLKRRTTNLTRVSVEEIEATIEEIHGNYITCKTPFYFANIEAKWRISPLSQWIDLNYAWNIDGKTFRLPYEEGMELGQKVIVEGTIIGASVNEGTGINVGVAVVRATVQGRKEDPMVGEVKVGVGVNIDGEGNPEDPDDDDDDDDGDDDDDDGNPFNPSTRVYCQNATTGAREQCTAEQRCCSGKGEDTTFKCRAPAECKDNALDCKTTDCSSNPTSQCLGGRFNTANENQCKCEDTCNEEFNRLWTTQSYNNSSYKPITRILSETGYSENGPGYWEQFEKLKKEAIDKCLTECDQCKNVPTLTVHGSDAVTKPGGYQYTVVGGRGPFIWSVSGTGATIDQNGNVTLAEDACGSITISARDACNQVGSMTARISNAGRWVYKPELYFVCGGGQVWNYSNGICYQSWSGAGLDQSKPRIETITGDTKVSKGQCQYGMSYYSCYSLMNCQDPCFIPRQFVSKPGHSCPGAEVVEDTTQYPDEYGSHRTFKVTGFECENMYWKWEC